MTNHGRDFRQFEVNGQPGRFAIRVGRQRKANPHDVGGVGLVFAVIGGDIGKRSAGLIRAGVTLMSIFGPPEGRSANGLAIDFVVDSDPRPGWVNRTSSPRKRSETPGLPRLR
jgi:hypothetical protein